MTFNVQTKFAPILDVGTVYPWGIETEFGKFEIDIIRNSHPDWKAWLESKKSGNKLVQRILKESVKGAMRNRRRSKKQRLTEEEVMDEAVDKATEEDQTDTIDLEELKEGLATVAIKDIRGLGTTTRHCTKCSNEWEPSNDKQICPSCGADQSESTFVGKPITFSPNEAAKLLANEEGDGAEVRWVPKELPHGGGPFGDCLANMLLEEMDEADSFYKSAKEEIRKN